VNYDEKRDFLRMPIDCSLTFSAVGDEREFKGKVINMSQNGILFTSRQRLEVGTLLSLVLTEAGADTPPMHATVKVERVINNRVQYEVACTFRRKFE
jgi:hypothetical protein